MEILVATRTVFTVSQFLDWQRSKTLDLRPIFQRRPAWKPSAKSLLIDSVVRGYPMPIILLRQLQDLESLKLRMEVVDGQQRLRTLLAFVDPSCLADFDEKRDRFTVRKIHNRDIADKPFSKLAAEFKQQILTYELSTHIFPATTGDDVIYRLFARLNSTGLPLTPQEIRNAQYHGAFKTLAYELSFRFVGTWRAWKLFSLDAIARMEEVEAVSDYLVAMLDGIVQKSQARITSHYKKYEEDLPNGELLGKRFEAVMSAISESIGEELPNTAFRRPAIFYSLFASVYDHMYGLASALTNRRPAALPPSFADAVERVSGRIRSGDLSEEVKDAMDKATSDKLRREIRHRFLMKDLGLVHRV